MKGFGVRPGLSKRFQKAVGKQVLEVADLVPHLLALITSGEGGPPGSQSSHRSRQC